MASMTTSGMFKRCFFFVQNIDSQNHVLRVCLKGTLSFSLMLLQTLVVHLFLYGLLNIDSSNHSSATWAQKSTNFAWQNLNRSMFKSLKDALPSRFSEQPETLQAYRFHLKPNVTPSSGCIALPHIVLLEPCIAGWDSASCRRACAHIWVAVLMIASGQSILSSIASYQNSGATLLIDNAPNSNIKSIFTAVSGVLSSPQT